MKVVILAGGKGLRLSEETGGGPKPMVDIAGRPLLVHIMESFAVFGLNEFVVCTGFKGDAIRGYFADHPSPWNISFIETGDPDSVGTAGRLLKVKEIIRSERCIVTYGDVVSDVDIDKLLKSHERSNSFLTIMAVHPRISFGVLQIDSEHKVTSFVEKPQRTDMWSNGGVFVLEPQVFGFIHEESEMFEHAPMERMVSAGGVNAYLHEGVRYPVDNPKDLSELRSVIRNGYLPWLSK